MTRFNLVSTFNEKVTMDSTVQETFELGYVTRYEELNKNSDTDSCWMEFGEYLDNGSPFDDVWEDVGSRSLLDWFKSGYDWASDEIDVES